jgi:phosphatidylserine decarboxylase
MSNKNQQTSQSTSVVDFINSQIDENPHYPFNLQSGWLPHPSSQSLEVFIAQLKAAPSQPYAPCIEALEKVLKDSDVLSYMMNDACNENSNILRNSAKDDMEYKIPSIESIDDFLDTLNKLLTTAPQFIDYDLVGLPFSAYVVGIDPTLSGRNLFRLPQFNQAMKEVLDYWGKSFLDKEPSNVGFRVDGEGWLSNQAKQQYQFGMWKKDNESLPYWNSWDSFFTREFENPEQARPVTEKENNRIVVSANDGSLFRWDDDVAAKDVFWFKDMQYSLADIFSSLNPEQQKIMDDNHLTQLFTGGTIFQTYLNPYNFHRWWCPVNGKIVFDPIVIDGCYFNKLLIPDYGGATTASLPYLVQVNARGLMVIKTDDYGYVACIPLGMSEVSSVKFDSTMIANASVTKGQEMGMFHYGGSSYVLIFQALPGKRLVFQSEAGNTYPKHPELPTGSASTGGNVTLIGAQIGKWENVVHDISANSSWQNIGYINEGETCTITYRNGFWTSNPNIGDDAMFDANGSPVTATQEGYALIGVPEGALVGRVDGGPPFLIGNGPHIIQQPGLLQVVINDDLHGCYGEGLLDNEGAITITAEVTK